MIEHPSPDALPAVTDAFDNLATIVCDRFARNVRIRRSLPGDGRVKIDRQLPFLCVYRQPASDADAGTRDLVTTEAAYLFLSGASEFHDGLSRFCLTLAATAEEHFGSFLLLEVWSEPHTSSADGATFRIVTSPDDEVPTTVAALQASLSQIEVNGRPATVTRTSATPVTPPGLPPLVPTADGSVSSGVVVLGLAVGPVYRDAVSGRTYPLVLRSLRRQLSRALRTAFYTFCGQGTDAVDHFESLGPSALTRAARQVDQQLCDVAASFDFLLQVTPVNSEDAWSQFREDDFAREPTFTYRPLPDDPGLLKRRLFEVPIEHIEDATLAHLYSEKQVELDRQLTALRDIGTSDFRYGSLQLYGGVEDALVAVADELLLRVPAGPSADTDAAQVFAPEIIEAARAEIARYRRRLPEFNATVVLSRDVAAGLMVARDRLFVSETATLRRERLRPLLHHEIGTHLLTWFNGRRQPLGLLAAGLAGYEPLQEGLAVLAEFLTGGLTASRLRNLAGRVLAARMMLDGVPFVETFHHLHHGRGFPPRGAFMTVLRAFRGGGLTKDAIYLRGFQSLLDFLRAGHDVEPLYVGKIGLQHVPFVRELRRRGVLQPPGVLPLFWNDPSLRDRIDACRRLSLLELAETVA